MIILGAGLFINAMNASAMPMPHDAPFLGINPINSMCHIIAENEAFTHQGPAETKFTINKNYILASCKAEYLVDKENPIEIEGRVEGIPCMIGIPGWAKLEVKGPSFGTGGFTVSQGGVVTATCKVPRS